MTARGRRPAAKKIAADTKPPMKISDEFVASLGRPRDPLAGPRWSGADRIKMFSPAQPYPGVVPSDAPKLAMDAGFADGFSAWATQSFSNFAFMEGYSFLGYPFLAQLAQVPEYRLIAETVAKESTRKWIKVESTSDEKTKKASGGKLPAGYKSKEKKIAALEDELKRLRVKEIFKLASEHDSFFGRSHIYIDTGDTDDRAELTKPIGDGGNFSEKKFEKGQLKAIRNVEPIWCYPSRYDASDPLKDSWYNPHAWYVMGKEVATSRLLTFVGRPVPDIFKPAFSFGGLSLTQMAKPYVDNWLQTRQSVNDIIHAFSVMVLSTDMSQVLQGGAATDFDKRVRMFTHFRDNKGLFVLNKENEDFKNVSAPLGSLDKLQAQAQEHVCSVSQIPLVKYTGISPSGLNASSEGELQVFYDNEHAYQEGFYAPKLDVVFRLAQINIWGKVDPDLRYVWNPLWELSEKERGELRKTEAETDDLYVNNGTVDQLEVRKRLASEPEGPYSDIDPTDVPEVEGPLPENIRQTDKVEEPGAGEEDDPEHPVAPEREAA